MRLAVARGGVLVEFLRANGMEVMARIRATGRKEKVVLRVY
jgi:hypothetical protein